MTTRRFATVFLAAAALSCAPVYAQRIATVTASTNMGSGFGTNIQNTVNGTGLSALTLTATHDGSSPGNSWVSAGRILTGNVTFDLGGSFLINTFSFWNQNGGGPGAAGSTGINAVQVQISTDGVTFTPLVGGPTNFAQVPGNTALPPEIFNFPAVQATQVRFVIGSNYGDPAETGFAEVGFGAAPAVESTYQLRYLANLDKGDSYVNLTNAGTLNGFDPAGRICVNVYTFDPAEEMISCCACPVTPNGLNSLSARNDLISNTLTPGVPTSVTVKLLSSLPLPGSTCNAASPNAANLVRGMRAWATTLHLNTAVLPAPGVYQATETPFSVAELSPSELSKLTSFCGFIQANGSGFGICKSCRFGALGAGIK